MSTQSGQPQVYPMQENPTEFYRRDSLENDERVPKRPRASKPKVKSGCITCKTRRVKCDETKPHCLRCKKFGRTCDGYILEPSPRGLIQLQPRIPSTSLYRPSVSIHVTEDENRYFQVFADCAAYELSGFFDDTFWTRLVLQESHSVTAIRHAVIALGALNKSLETASGPNLKVNVIQTIDKQHHEQAVFQYLKAIQALNQYISESGSPQLRTALIACLLFICFETFQGSFASSIQQIYGGIKLLRGYYQGKPGTRHVLPPPTKPRKQSLQPRTSSGCDSIRNEAAIPSHIEEYLQSPSNQQSQPDPSPQPCLGDSQRRASGPGEQQRRHILTPKTTVTEADIYTGQPRTMNIFSLGDSGLQPSDSRGFYREPSPHQSLPKSVLRKNSLAMTNSTASTPSFTPPPTGPQTSISLPSNQTITSTRKRSLSIPASTPPLLQNDLHVEEILIQNFARLDGPGLFFGTTPGIPPLTFDIHKIWHLPIPTVFPSFASAQRCWDFLMDRCLQFYRRTLFNRAYSPQNQDSDQAIARQYSEYMDQLSAFERAFQPVLEAAISPEGAISHAPSLVLSLYQKCTVITLSQVTAASEMIYDSYLSSFQYIVRTCTLLISAESTIKMPRNRRFSFEVGVVPPLHVTAAKCRDPGLRRRAVELLFGSPRQEGMWDSVVIARIGRWLIGCEEEGLDPPPSAERSGLFENIARQTFPVGKGRDKQREDQTSYPSPPVHDTMGHGGGWESGIKISEVVNISIGRGPHGEDSSSDPSYEKVTLPKRGRRKRNGSGENESWVDGMPLIGAMEGIGKGGWFVPEANRVVLTVVSFHIPDRYIRVTCQRVGLRADGTREERDAVIAW